MLYKLKLKNSEKTVVVDDLVFDFISKNEYLNSIGFVDNLRMHSSGYAFFQKNWPTRDGKYKNETIYLHKLIAEKFIVKPDSERRLFVTFKNGNPLNCRLDNLEWNNISAVGRNTKKTENKFGYRGVHKNCQKFRAVIYNNGERIDLGLYETPEAAAMAYNKKSEELFGKTRSLNVIKTYEGGASPGSSGSSGRSVAGGGPTDQSIEPRISAAGE